MAGARKTIGIAMAIGGASPQLEATVRSLAKARIDEIAIADASGDPAVRSCFAPIRDRIAHYVAEPDFGQSDGLNKAFSALNTDFVGWLNDDDFLVMDVGDLIQDSCASADVVHGESVFFDVVGRVIGYHPNIETDPKTLVRECTISQPSCFFRRDLLLEAGGLDEELHYVMDWDLWQRFEAMGARFKHVPLILSGVTIDRRAKTSKGSLRRCKELYDRARAAGRVHALKTATSGFAHNLRWQLLGGDIPPILYFDAWRRRSGEVRAPSLATATDATLFHRSQNHVSGAIVHWVSGSTSFEALGAPIGPFRTFRLQVPNYEKISHVRFLDDAVVSSP